MIPTSLKLRNWCQHRDLEVVFARGLNMIQGPNGSGKSNLVDAMLMALTGESNNVVRKTDRKTDNITVGEEKGAIYLGFEHQERPGMIVVNLSRNYRTDADVLRREIEYARAQVVANGEGQSGLSEEALRLVNFTPREKVDMKLEWGEGDDKLALKGQSKVLEWVSNVIGLQPKAIKSQYFPVQGSIDDLISGDSDTRYRTLAEQAGIVLCPRIHKELGAEISSQPTFDGVEERLQSLTAEIAALDRQLTEAQEQLESASKERVDPEPLRQLINDYQRASAVRTKISENESAIAQFKTKIDSLSAELETLIEEGKKGAKRLQEAEEAYTGSEAVMMRRDQQQNTLSQLNTLEVDIVKTRAAIAELGDRPVPSVDPSLAEKLNEDLGSVQSAMEERGSWLSTFSDGRCPTCGFDGKCSQCGKILMGFDQKSEDTKEEIKQLQEKKDSLTSQLLEVRSKIQEDEQKISTWDTKSASLSAQLSSLEQQMASIERPTEDQLVTQEQYEQAAKALSVYQALKTEVEGHRAIYREKAGEHNRLRNEVEVRSKILNEARKEVEGSPTEDQFKQASEQYSRYQVVDQRIREAERQLAEVRAVRESKAKDLAEVQAQVEQMKPVRDWINIVSRVRDRFHKNSLPRDAVLWYANRLVAQNNGYLQEYDGTFTMAMDDDMSFLALFENGKIQPAGRLSGGEKNMLNLSLRFSYADLYPSDFRFMELDEVEVHLDQENVARLPAIFEKVKGMARNRGMVVPFISHHPTLAEIADHVISL